jgi:hypothetical protein
LNPSTSSKEEIHSNDILCNQLPGHQKTISSLSIKNLIANRENYLIIINALFGVLGGSTYVSGVALDSSKTHSNISMAISVLDNIAPAV